MSLRTLLFTVFCAGVISAGPINVYFAPDGGFCPENKNRTITFPDGKEVTATLGNALCDMIERTEEKGQIKICLYSLGDQNMVEALVKAALEKQIRVKLLLDACADWTAEQRKQIIERVKSAESEAEKNRKDFDFQIRIITPQSMEDRGRIRDIEEDGGEKRIFGTMHEKFGVFYTASSLVPYDCFAGSSNVSTGSDQIYAENRIFFHDRPSVARQFQEEFARLWNEYGKDVCGRCQSEMYVPAYPEAGDVRVVFNGEPITEDLYYRIDEELEKIISKVNWKKGSVDIAMFSFTHRDLAEAVVKFASRRKSAKFRVLLDQTQIGDTDTHRGVLGPWFEEQAREKKLENLEVRYKWRSNAYGLDTEITPHAVHLIHFRNLLLHHKLLIVNRSILAAGSYNWSSSAEERNLENIMIFDRKYRGQEEVVDRFLNEYEAIWNSLKKTEAVSAPVTGPQTVTGPQGRELEKQIVSLLSDEKNLKIRDLIEKNSGLLFSELQKETGLVKEDLEKRIDLMVKATILCSYEKNGKILLAD